MKHAVRTIGSVIRASKYDMETREEFVWRRHKRKLDIATLIEKPLITHGSDWTHFQGSPTLTVSAENRRTLAIQQTGATKLRVINTTKTVRRTGCECGRTVR